MIDLSKTKAIFFDAGGTLFKPHPSVGEVYAEVAHGYGLEADCELIETVFHALWKERDGLACLAGRRASLAGHSGEKEERKWWRSLVWDVFTKIGELTDFDKFFDELHDRFAHPDVWRLFPDVFPVLQAAKKRNLIVGIVSNWDSRLFGICEGLGLKPYLDFILASAVVGAAKPSPKIFKEALRQACVTPEEAIHVGDSLIDDIWGAEQVGIKGIFIDRSGTRASNAVTVNTLQFFNE